MTLNTTNKLSALANASVGLPALIGTPKQIAWAETIRAEFLPRLAQQVAHFVNTVQTDPHLFASDVDAFVERVHETENAVREQAEAAWWIDENKKGLRPTLMLADVAQWATSVMADRKADVEAGGIMAEMLAAEKRNCGKTVEVDVLNGTARVGNKYGTLSYNTVIALDKIGSNGRRYTVLVDDNGGALRMLENHQALPLNEDLAAALECRRPIALNVAAKDKTHCLEFRREWQPENGCYEHVSLLLTTQEAMQIVGVVNSLSEQAGNPILSA